MSLAEEILKQIKKPLEVEVRKGVFITYPALDRVRRAQLAESYISANMHDDKGNLDMAGYHRFLNKEAYPTIIGWRGVTYSLLLEGSPHINIVAVEARNKPVEFSKETLEMLDLVDSPFRKAIGAKFFKALTDAMAPETEEAKK